MYTRRKQDQILTKRTAQLSINLSQQEKKRKKKVGNLSSYSTSARLT